MKALVLAAACLLAAPAWSAPSAELIRRDAIKVEPAGDLPDAVYTKIKGYKVVAVGEVHGTNEAPDFVLRLLRLYAKKGRGAFLALEIGAEEQANVDRFLESGKLEVLRGSAFFKRDFQDGRSSEAMARLLAGVRALRGTRVVCFDTMDATSWQDRDTRMARAVSAAYAGRSGAVAVLLAGNMHTAVETDPFPKHRPMVRELHAMKDALFKRGDILAIRHRFAGGSAWMCPSGAVKCAAVELGRDQSGYATAVSWPGYFLKEQEMSEGHDATYFSRAVSASPPLAP